jgi:hypothetical protein
MAYSRCRKEPPPPNRLSLHEKKHRGWAPGRTPVLSMSQEHKEPVQNGAGRGFEAPSKSYCGIRNIQSSADEYFVQWHSMWPFQAEKGRSRDNDLRTLERPSRQEVDKRLHDEIFLILN